MKDDPAIQWIREVRHQISAEFDHDPRKLLEYYMELQKKYEDRLVKAPSNKEQPESVEA